MMSYRYTDSDYQELEAALIRAESVAYGRPDQFQYYQNELNKEIAHFLLRPYKIENMKLKKVQNKQKTS